jgi:peptidoglycan/xylan/chitin deacetylase (PgdA/CDA1 family)
VALTFDDGPWPEFTPKVLEVLDRFGVKATFNVMGYNAQHHSSLLLEEVKRGHEIGNHTWSHLDLTFQSPSITLDEIRLGRDAIEDVTGIRTRFFRPPRGELTGSAARYAAQFGHDILLWSIAGDVPGFERSEEVYDHVSTYLAPGGIIGFHDGIGRETFHLNTSGADNLRERRRAEVDALPRVLEMIMGRGYQVMTVTQLLALEPTILPAGGPTSGAGNAAVPK